jgi:hypothetical protein
VLAFLVIGALVLMRAFHLEFMARSGVVVVTNPWNHSLLICSIQGCYAISPE